MTGQTRNPALEWAISAVRGRLAPALLSPAQLGEFAGTYGGHRFVLIGDHLEYQSCDGTCSMIPIGEDTFLLEGVYAERFRFSRDEGGQVTAVVTLTQAGPGDTWDKVR
jgi:hypothetical protein